MKMTHAVWMKDTVALARPRSPELKKIDSALLAYEKALQNSGGSVLGERRALQQALEAWKKAQQDKGQDWRTSVRNKLKAVEKLDAELGAVIVGAGGLNSRGELMLDPGEVRAAKILADDIRNNTRQMFSGQTLTVKNGKALADLNDVRSAMSAFKSSSKEIREAARGVVPPNLTQQVRSTLVSLFGDAAAAQAREALGPVFTEFLTNVTPFVGAIKSGGNAIVKWGQAAKGLYKKHQMEEASTSFAPGDPAAAFAAILVIQQREVKMYATSASIYTVSAAANGKPGWKFEVEAMVLKAQPVFEKARSVIQESRYELAGMRGMKGAVVDHTARTIGIPTGKLSGLVEDVTRKIDRIGA